MEYAKLSRTLLLDLTMGLLGIQTTEDLSRDLLIAANEDQMGAAAVQ
jgi:hypothetical protein